MYNPARKLFFRFRTAYLVKRKMTAALAPAIIGAITQEARIWPSPCHPQFTPLDPRTANPTPTTDPTIVWVDDVGKPILVEIVNHV
jgi:hypothetical protein